MREKRWRLRPVNPEWEAALRKAGYPPLAARLLASRGCDSPESAEHFLNPRLTDLYSPFLLKDMDRAVRLLVQALKERWRIRLITDYDVDGQTSGALFWRFLRQVYRHLGLPAEELVDCVTPDRFREGYGLNPERIRQAAADGVRLVITFDCGIKSRDEVALAHALGLRIIVTDHHSIAPGEPLPEADAVINPKRPDCPFPYKGICGVAIAFYLAWGLLHALRGNVRSILPSLDFVAVGTVADMMELRDVNRAFVRFGLQLLNGEGLTVDGQWIVPPGWRRRALTALTGRKSPDDAGVIDTGTIGFQIGPRINALGRVGDANRGIAFLLQDDPEVIAALLPEIESANDLRQRLTDAGVELVRQSIDPGSPPDAIVFSSTFAELGEHAHLMRGVVGIIAGRIGQEFYCPTFVLQEGPDGLAVGSARGILPAFDLFEAMSEVRHLFERFGGHKQAAGLTIRTENLPLLREHISRCVARLSPEERQPEVLLDAEVTAEDLEAEHAAAGFPLITLLRQLEPYGIGNPKPLLWLRAARVVEARGVGRTDPKQHLKLRLRPPGSRLVFDAIAWHQYPRYLAENQPEVIDIAFFPEINEYMGQQRLQLVVAEWRQSMPHTLAATEIASG